MSSFIAAPKGCWSIGATTILTRGEYEEVYLHAYESVSQAEAGIERYLDFHNNRRPHSALDRKTPDEFYFASLPATQKAA